MTSAVENTASVWTVRVCVKNIGTQMCNVKPAPVMQPVFMARVERRALVSVTKATLENNVTNLSINVWVLRYVQHFVPEFQRLIFVLTNSVEWENAKKEFVSALYVGEIRVKNVPINSVSSALKVTRLS